MRNHGLRDFEAGVAVLEREIAEIPAIRGPHDYADDPVGYARNILGFKFLWSEQEEILRSLLTSPHRTLVKAGHSVGKTCLAAIAVNWWYDSFDPGVVISTAPDHRSVCDLLWAEIRTQRLRAGLGDLLPAAPEMRSSPNHYAKGFTALSGDSFQGRHPDRLLIVFDEAVGISHVFWETSVSMWKPEPGFAWLAIFNPTNTASQAFIEDHSTDIDGKPTWRQFTLDCLEHPNVKGQTKEDKPTIPAAVTWAQVHQWVQMWCIQIPANEAGPTDIEWPAGSGKYWKQGPSFLARCRGLWPSGGAWTVWCELNWQEALRRGGNRPPVDLLPEIGCDTASGGEDYSSIHVRWGNESYYHESSNAWKAPDLMGRLKEQARIWADKATAARPQGSQPISPKQIVMKIDDDGFGRAVSQIMISQGYNVIQIGAGTKSISGLYPNKRSELWFQVSDRATGGWIGLARLEKAVTDRLRQQLLCVEYRLNAAGMRVVEDKDITREKIGRSPDDADALNLAYLEGFDMGTAKFVEGNQQRDPWQSPRDERGRDTGSKRNIWGS